MCYYKTSYFTEISFKKPTEEEKMMKRKAALVNDIMMIIKELRDVNFSESVLKEKVEAALRLYHY